MPQWLTGFCSWLQQTAFSQMLQNVEWIVPAVQTIHILAIGAVISSALIINLHGGELTALSQVELGSTFTIDLPAVGE